MGEIGASGAESNPRHPLYKGGVLPLNYGGKIPERE